MGSEKPEVRIQNVGSVFHSLGFTNITSTFLPYSAYFAYFAFSTSPQLLFIPFPARDILFRHASL